MRFQNEYLLDVSEEIAILGCGADDRKRSEMMCTRCRLGDQTEDLMKQVLLLSCTEVCLRFHIRR